MKNELLNIENTKNTNKISKKRLRTQIKHFFKNKANIIGLSIIFFVVCFVSVFSVYLGGGFTPYVKIEASANMLRVVQARLTEMGYYNDNINGVFNTQTQDALKQFQKDFGLVETGELNDATTTALGVSADEQTNSELYLLAKLIYSEARGEVYTGQVAVGAVVLNRVENAGFPNTMQGVIYQPWAFTALHDGQFNLEPNATAYQAAQDAMNGWDPSYGSLYYYNPTTATSSWIFSRTTIVVIGNHVFAI